MNLTLTYLFIPSHKGGFPPKKRTALNGNVQNEDEHFKTGCLAWNENFLDKLYEVFRNCI